MLPQEAMIERARELCHRDERIVSVLMYGSFALGQGGRFSDIEFYLFFAEEASEGLREEAWVAQIAPLELYYVNEFGNLAPRAGSRRMLRLPPTNGTGRVRWH